MDSFSIVIVSIAILIPLATIGFVLYTCRPCITYTSSPNVVQVKPRVRKYNNMIMNLDGWKSDINSDNYSRMVIPSEIDNINGVDVDRQHIASYTLLIV